MKTLRGDRNQCPTCRRYFNSTHAFEKHRTGTYDEGRRCMTEDEMLSRGMVLGADDFWRGSAMPSNAIPAERFA